MKLSELKPCAKCGGKLPPLWHVVRTSIAMLDPSATRGVLGLHTYFGGSSQALALAEVMAPVSDCVIIMGDKEPSLWTEIHICQTCYMDEPLDLPMLLERVKESVE